VFTWKVLGAALLVAALLGGIKYLFDVVERKHRPKD
jgi:hypothetical protein